MDCQVGSLSTGSGTSNFDPVQGSVVTFRQKMGVAYSIRRLVILDTLKDREAGRLGQAPNPNIHPFCSEIVPENLAQAHPVLHCGKRLKKEASLFCASLKLYHYFALIRPSMC